VGCKVLSLSVAMLQNLRFTLTMWDVKWKNLGPVNEDIEVLP